MDDFTIARIVHVVAVLFWIGGVGFVTWVVMPTIRQSESAADRLGKFHAIEGRFAGQAKLWVLVAGASGFWMVHRADMWSRFADPGFWWMYAMVALWAVFTLMLFVIEPVFLHRRLATSQTPQDDFQRMERVHHILVALALITLAGAVGGSHGLF
ncbi:MAG: hypothetical protein C0456_19920 [Hyphomonas sp.]|uniref:hypothetical protein n=1 Tax=Hyphomonas sp. TaxID=87 RepID=UPI001E010E47|nr:hypothetical protein [Hyphomonas sp.]MBA4228869.1 hypothetical protein [Hyphomonas sp.]